MGKSYIKVVLHELRSGDDASPNFLAFVESLGGDWLGVLDLWEDSLASIRFAFLSRFSFSFPWRLFCLICVPFCPSGISYHFWALNQYF